jgi:uncharacterized delta-60 repeat protein
MASVSLAALDQSALAAATVVDSQGKITIAGHALSAGFPTFLVARLNPNGTLDNTFNGNGIELLSPGSGVQSAASAVAFYGHSQIVVAGGIQGANGISEIEVARLNLDGSLDLTFGGSGNGIVLYADTQDRGSMGCNALAIQSDGKIVVSGSDSFNNNTYFALVRFNTDGTVDTSFQFSNAGLLTGQAGLVLTDFPTPAGTGHSAYVNGLVIAPNGTIAAAGTGLDAIGNQRFAVDLYNPNGTPDADFNGVGREMTSLGTSDLGFGIACQSDGNFVVSGSTIQGTNAAFTLLRYHPDGTLDPSFGAAGVTSTNFPDGTGGPIGNGIQVDYAGRLALQADGKIVVVGLSEDANQFGGRNFAVARFNPDGSLDSTFNFDGLVTTDLFGGERNDTGIAVGLQADGKITIVGDSVDAFGNEIIGVARYTGDPGQLQLSSLSVTLGEGAGNAILTVTRTGGATGPVTVHYATSDGSAAAGADYSAVSGNLAFGDSQTSQAIIIPIVNDATLEGGSETFFVTLSNPTGGASLGAQSTEQVTIRDPDMVTYPVNVVEGVPFTRVLARFLGSNPNLPMGDYAATIIWGDNTTSAGTLTPDPKGGFDVTGTNTYAEEELVVAQVSISGGYSISGNENINVLDASLKATAINLTVTGNKNLSGPVATFTDADPGGAAPDYKATITWDDGTTSIGTISGFGPFTVSGSHVFGAFNGTHQISIAIADFGGSKTSVVDDVIDPTPNELYVMQLYQDLLGRAVDPSGLASWSGLLDAGTPRSQVAVAITQSQEYRQDEVQALYAHYLYRNADPAGLAAFTQVLANGGTVEQIAAAIVSSAEYYQNRSGGTNAGFLDALYHDGLGRTIDPAGAAFFSQALAGGESHAQVAAALFGSTEYRNDLVQGYYQSFLHRPADAAGLAAFSDALASGMRDETVLATLLGSEEFFAKL